MIRGFEKGEGSVAIQMRWRERERERYSTVRTTERDKTQNEER